MRAISLIQPRRIQFGAGSIRDLPACLQADGHNQILVICDPAVESHAQKLQDAICALRLSCEICTEVMPEPTYAAMNTLLNRIKGQSFDALVGLGGGSTMDMTKILAVLLNSEQSIADIIGIGNVQARNCGLYTIPTTSGTGSEVTPIAVLTDEEEQLKKGVVSEYLVADAAFVDPELTTGVPPAVTAATGMDAFTHCIESYININHHELVDGYALTGMQLIAESIEQAVRHGNDVEARARMSMGSLCGGLCLGPVNTAAVHALAYPLGGQFNIPHGVANAVLLPHVMAFNQSACEDRLAEVARRIQLTANTDSDADLSAELVRFLRDLSHRLGIPASLREMNIPEHAISVMAQEAMKVTRLLNNNPRPVSKADAEGIYQAAWDG